MSIGSIIVVYYYMGIARIWAFIRINEHQPDWLILFPRSLTPTKTRSQSLWSACTWTLTLTALRRSWGSVSRWVFTSVSVCVSDGRPGLSRHYTEVLWGRLIFGSDSWTLACRIVVNMVRQQCDLSDLLPVHTVFPFAGLLRGSGAERTGCVLYHAVIIEVHSDAVWLRLLSDYTTACNWPIRLVVNSKSFLSRRLLVDMETMSVRLCHSTAI